MTDQDFVFVLTACGPEIVGDDKTDRNTAPSLGGEDFAYMLQARPGAYGWIGNGPGTGGCLLHNPRYDFNDEALPIGVSYWVSLVGRILGRGATPPA